jgi:hypothetical protein
MGPPDESGCERYTFAAPAPESACERRAVGVKPLAEL